MQKKSLLPLSIMVSNRCEIVYFENVYYIDVSSNALYANFSEYMAQLIQFKNVSMQNL